VRGVSRLNPESKDSMPTRVKICGIKRAEDALLAVELGASALGFNFYPKSPRYIQPAAAARIIQQLPPFVTAVGIFADECDGARVAAVAREAGASAVQLAGPRFPPEDEALKAFFIIRAVAVADDFRPEVLAKLKADAFLLDAHHPQLLGGTGKTFNWDLVKEAKQYGTIILAGGLTPENVGEAIRQVRPYAVDVASGVESSPRVKDPAKLRAFFAAVAEAERNI
jgi:phosphoribosylanthranilate isomerase